MGVDWPELVKAVLEDPDRFIEIQNTLNTILRILAAERAGREANDCLQAGWLRIWRVLSKVDLTMKGWQIRAYLINAGAFGIRDEVRRLGRQSARAGKPAGYMEELYDYPTEEIPETLEFDGILNKCLAYVRDRGTMVGAYTAVGQDMGIKPEAVAKRFRAEAKRWIERNRVEKPPRRYAEALRKALKGTEFEGMVDARKILAV